MTTKLNKTQKIVRWASLKKTRPISHAVTDLNCNSEKSFRFLVQRLKRFGLINYEIIGRNISFKLTALAYYDRKNIVV